MTTGDDGPSSARQKLEDRQDNADLDQLKTDLDTIGLYSSHYSDIYSVTVARWILQTIKGHL